jgi:hypothetical protein
MDRTLTAVHNMITALGAIAFDIGVLSEKGMLPGFSDLPASTVLGRVPLLKYQNAHGAHIYIRPAGQHRLTVLDDLNREAVTLWGRVRLPRFRRPPGRALKVAPVSRHICNVQIRNQAGFRSGNGRGCTWKVLRLHRYPEAVAGRGDRIPEDP